MSKPHPRIWALALIVPLCGTQIAAAAPNADRVAQLCEQLTANAPAARQRAATRLGELYPEATTSVPILVEALTDEAPEVRAAAASALERFGREALPGFCTYVATQAKSASSAFVTQGEFFLMMGGGLSVHDVYPFLWSGHSLERQISAIAWTNLPRTVELPVERADESTLHVLQGMAGVSRGDVQSMAQRVLALKGWAAAAKSKPLSAEAAKPLAALLASEHDAAVSMAVYLLGALRVEDKVQHKRIEALVSQRRSLIAARRAQRMLGMAPSDAPAKQAISVDAILARLDGSIRGAYTMHETVLLPPRLVAALVERLPELGVGRRTRLAITLAQIESVDARVVKALVALSAAEPTQRAEQPCWDLFALHALSRLPPNTSPPASFWSSQLSQAAGAKETARTALVAADARYLAGMRKTLWAARNLATARAAARADVAALSRHKDHRNLRIRYAVRRALRCIGPK